ncbi:MAG: AIR synthase, partial [Eubacteriaceae bacterium]|nr:AIR synthase [Eubacteriaceae bacterium]
DDSVLKKIIFNNIKYKREEVLLGSGTGIDSSIINLGSDLLVVTTDPITAADNNIGRLCVNICCNDIAAAGGEPVAILVTLLMPYDYDINDIEKIICELDSECEKLNVQLAGGHTEKTDAVTRLVLVATVIGKKKSFIQQKVNPGDILIMTKSAGLEGSSIIASDYEDKFNNILDKNQINFLKNLINEISVIPESKIACRHNAKCMHDITEGGVLGAAWEMSKLANCNIEVYCDEISIYDETKIICKNLNIDPLRLISSGSMLIAAYEKDADIIIKELISNKINAKIIGKFIEGKSVYIKQNETYDLAEPGEDEIYKI